MTKERKHGKIVCKCQCDCGNVVYVTKDDLLWGGTKSCGCLKEENSHKPRPLKKIGDIVNNWELLELKETRKQKDNYIYLWHCKCICCGEEKDVWSNNFATTKCEIRKEIDKKTLKKIKEDKLILPVPSNIEDITNEKFGKLKVLGFAGEVNYRYYWTCKCECGTIKVIRMDSLMNGSIVSCGCYHKEITKKSIKDLTGQKFGKLTVVERVYNHKYKTRSAIWKCRCECGNYILTTSNSLTSGHTTSCGCIKSKGEYTISKFLFSQNILFETQISFNECKDKILLRFDFKIYYPNSEKYFLCEYQGEQHYHPVKYNTEWTDKQIQENFDNYKRRDQIKRDYCKANNIKLLEIPYWDFENIDIILEEELKSLKKGG